MSQAHDIRHIVQDGPPSGGFAPIRFRRRLPPKGPSSIALLAGSALIMAFGFFKVGSYNLERREARLRKIEARKALLPILQAEEDARYVKQKRRLLEIEKEIMRDVPGWKAGESVYSQGQWAPPMGRS